MNNIACSLFLLFFSTYSAVLSAVTIVECKDQAGEQSFHELCPPGTTMVQQKVYQTAIPGPEQPDLTVLIYLAPECPACEAYRTFFAKYGIKTNEKNIADNQELQTELTNIAGDLKIPTVIIGETVLSDFKEGQLITVLERLGFTLVESTTQQPE